MPPRANAAYLLHQLRRLTVPRAGGAASDADLLRVFLVRRDEAAFAALVARHGPMVLRLCRRVLSDAHAAEDCFQATFLVLARRAASVRRRDSLAAWLYGVAMRVARKARAAASRRRERETPRREEGAADPRPNPLDLLTARELLAAVDEEVRRLPEVYRLPVILCCLEGRTREEAARQLGWTEGSVKGRLERGRARLHARLTRRGLTLMAALAAIEASRDTAAASVCGAAIAATAKAATALAAGKGSASAAVVALAEGGLKAMLPTKLKIAAALLLTTTVVALGGASVFFRAEASAPPAGGQPDAREPSRKEAGGPVAPDESIAWGDSVGGLRAGLSVQGGKRSFHVGERASFVFTVASVGDKPITFSYVLPIFYNGGDPTVRDAAGKAAAVVVSPPPAFTTQVVMRETLGPGKSLDLGNPGFVIRPPRWDGKCDETTLFADPGKYKVRQSYRLQGASGDGAGAPTLTSGDLELEVVAAEPAGPRPEAAKEGGPTPAALIRAATTPQGPGEAYPVLPALSTEMRGRVANEIIGSAAVRAAYAKLDVQERNVTWFKGVEELEKEKAVWCLASCLCHPSQDVQIHALRSLERVGDRRPVEFIALYAEYMAVGVEGSENATIHGVIHEAAARTLSALTGVRVELKGQDPEGLKRGVRLWRKWLCEQGE